MTYAGRAVSTGGIPITLLVQAPADVGKSTISICSLNRKKTNCCITFHRLRRSEFGHSVVPQANHTMVNEMPPILRSFGIVEIWGGSCSCT
ncbi:hypothetical protein AFLA_000389 [Aspergillus flavus NRRL3357]|nr:hypothetical protein AFLA_000389 [Aspergillus flavus NRRL3357]